MGSPAWVHHLGLYNDVELGPNCPPAHRCQTCSERWYCAYTDLTTVYEPTRWQVQSMLMFRELLDDENNGKAWRKRTAWRLAAYLIHHRGYGRLAETLLYMAQELRKEARSCSQGSASTSPSPSSVSST